SADRSHVRVALAVFDADGAEVQSGCSLVGEEEVRPRSDAFFHAVLQQPMDDVDSRAVELLVGTTGDTHGEAAVKEHLEPERPRHWAREADVVGRLRRLLLDGTE